jgi:hypothetical protein
MNERSLADIKNTMKHMSQTKRPYLEPSQILTTAFCFVASNMSEKILIYGRHITMCFDSVCTNPIATALLVWLCKYYVSVCLAGYVLIVK